MAKKITIDSLNSAIQKKKETFTLTVNDEWVVTIDREFSKEGIINVIQDFSKFIEKYGRANVSGSVLTSYLYILLLREFTDLRDVITGDVENQLAVVKKLIELDIFPVLIDALPESEMKKVSEFIKESTNRINELMDEYNKEVNNLDLKNKDLLSSIQ